MVAVANRVSRNGCPPVTVAAGEEASGLARMIGQYLEQLLSDSPEKRSEAAALRGRFGLRAQEGDVAVTIVFDDHGIVIREGLEDPDATISGEIESLMHVLAGRVNPAWSLWDGAVAVRSDLRYPLFGYQAYHLMRLPGVHLWSGLPRPPAGLLVGAAATAGVLLLAVYVRRRAAGGGDA